jgi:hypothetical protein
MDQLVSLYISSKFGEELGNEIRLTFELLAEYNYPNLFTPYEDIITRESFVDSASLADEFILRLHQDLKFVLSLHFIKVVEDTNLTLLNTLAEAFITLQHLADYTHVLLTLETMDTDEEKLIGILSEYTGLDEVTLLEIIEHFDPKILVILKQVALVKEGRELELEDVDVVKNKTKILEDIKLFGKFISEDAVGVQLVKIGAPVLQPLETYFNMIHESINTNSSTTIAIDFLSLILISENNKENPRTVYKEHTHLIAASLADLLSIESEINRIYVDFVQLRKINNE